MSIFGLLCSTQFVSFSFFLLFWLLSLICLKNELCIHIENWVQQVWLGTWKTRLEFVRYAFTVQWSDGPLCLTTLQRPLPLSGELGSGCQFSRRHKGNERLLLSVHIFIGLLVQSGNTGSQLYWESHSCFLFGFCWWRKVYPTTCWKQRVENS